MFMLYVLTVSSVLAKLFPRIPILRKTETWPKKPGFFVPRFPCVDRFDASPLAAFAAFFISGPSEADVVPEGYPAITRY